jgi:CheY-like chemotaxis protein
MYFQNFGETVEGGLVNGRALILLWVLIVCWLACLYPLRLEAQGKATIRQESTLSPPQDEASTDDADRQSELEESTSWDRPVPKIPPSSAAAPSGNEREALALAVALFLAGILLVRKMAARVADYLNARYDPWRALSQEASDSFHWPEFVEFFAVLRNGQVAMIGPSVVPEPGAINEARAGGIVPKPGAERAPELDPLQDFLDAAPAQIVSLRNLFSALGRAPDQGAQRKILLDLVRQVKALRASARLPTLVPAWQMATALVGLLQQLANRDSNITPSAIRTAGMAVDMLETLSNSGLPPDLATEPAVRLLVVDDDPVSRHALGFALGKTFDKPDLAPEGKTALVRVARHPYDVIFLDVEMPGMDGFELRSKIRSTGLNRNTPVVFVTGHSDFESRAKSALAGGHELIGKPFLPFEITVKAFTLVLRSRLQAARAISKEDELLEPASVGANR